MAGPDISRCIKCAAPALVGVAAAIFTPSLDGRGMVLASQLRIEKAQATDAYDDGLLVSGGRIASAPNDGRITNNADWMKVETDACGFPERAETKKSMMRDSGLDDEINAPGDAENLDDLGPADQAWALVGRSLSAHPEIAVISDGVGKTCDDNVFDNEDDNPEIIAGWRGVAERQKGWAPYIA